jgi:hypothetical protein
VNPQPSLERFSIDVDREIRVTGKRTGKSEAWDLSVSSAYPLTMVALKQAVAEQIDRSRQRLETLKRLHEVLEDQSWQSITKAEP